MNTHQILLKPTDVLFFRDGRPIEGSLAGHGAAWPLPHVTNAALHAALHRAYPMENSDKTAHQTGHGDHLHRVVRQGIIHQNSRSKRFGSVVTAGPFPVKSEGATEIWHFPRPGDIDGPTLAPTLFPSANNDWTRGTLRQPLKYAVANFCPPSKETKAKAWIAGASFERYLKVTEPAESGGVNDGELFDAEHNVGIAIDPETQTTGQGEAAGKIYSAQYLRLREGWRLGQFASARNGEAPLLENMLNAENGRPVIVVGGQQRICTAESRAISKLPLPIGFSAGFRVKNQKHLVKWVLLTPAIWPEMTAGTSKRGTERQTHPGGWIPNWIDAELGNVLLRTVTFDQRRNRRKQNYAGEGYSTEEGGAQPIAAKLVAALIPKPIAITGWSLGEGFPDDSEARKAGAKSTHLAVPAGAVYYFEADSQEDAQRLAAALNWHGSESNPAAISNRRSTLMGEKGFGLGVCGTWEFFEDVAGRRNP